MNQGRVALKNLLIVLKIQREICVLVGKIYEMYVYLLIFIRVVSNNCIPAGSGETNTLTLVFICCGGLL